MVEGGGSLGGETGSDAADASSVNTPAAPEVVTPEDAFDPYENSVEVELHLIPRRPYGYVRRWVLWESPCHRGAEAEARRRYDALIPELLHPPFLPRPTAEPTGPSYEIRLSLMGPEREEAHTVLGRFRTRREALVAYRQVLEQIRGQRWLSGHFASSAAGADDSSEGLFGLPTLPCGRPLGHRSGSLSQPALRFVHCLDTCISLRGQPRHIRYIEARRRGFIDCPHCGHASRHIKIDDAWQVLPRVPTPDLQMWLRQVGRPEHSPTPVGLITAVWGELMVRAELQHPWWYGQTWLDRFLETGERPANGEPDPDGPETSPAPAPGASVLSSRPQTGRPRIVRRVTIG